MLRINSQMKILTIGCYVAFVISLFCFFVLNLHNELGRISVVVLSVSVASLVAGTTFFALYKYPKLRDVRNSYIWIVLALIILLLISMWSYHLFWRSMDNRIILLITLSGLLSATSLIYTLYCKRKE